MNTGKTLFAQIMDFLPWKTFHRIVARHGGDKGVRVLTYAEQIRAMAFAQLTYRESLRDIGTSQQGQMVIRHADLFDWQGRKHWRGGQQHGHGNNMLHALQFDEP